MEKNIKIFHIDAFADTPFTGNPAALCPLEAWLPDEVMQDIAKENNLSETAFFVKEDNGFRIRWFTPAVEVTLCGHATLAAAWCIFNESEYDKETITFQSQSGPLIVTRKEDLITLDFPADPPVVCETPQALIEALGDRPIECLKAMDYMAVLSSEAAVAACRPNLELLKKLGLRGVIITALSDKASEYDFVSRFFAPNFGILEDPVTGSAHTQLTPYWAGRLGKKQFTSRQLSPRGGTLYCEVAEDRVHISGKALKYMSGTIYI